LEQLTAELLLYCRLDAQDPYAGREPAPRPTAPASVSPARAAARRRRSRGSVTMRPSQVVLMAGRALRRNKARSLLTALGVIIGVAAVIAMMAVSEGQNWSTGVTGTSPDYFAIRAWKVASGELFSAGDLEAGAKVVVLGQTVVENLFGTAADPVGQFIRIKDSPFLVAGVLQRKGQSAMGQDADDEMFVPHTTFMSKIQQTSLQKYVPGAIMVSAASAAVTEQAQAEITALLRARHHLTEGQDDDFSIRNLTEVAAAMESGARTMTLLLASVAAVSLVVGGIGIMNIMLVSVTERTREIGLRMAVGATTAVILWQFLSEALALSTAGGTIGVAVGLFAAWRIAAAFSWTFPLQPGVIALAVGFSALVGVVFGLYPARKASKLDPIDALRFE
jgi:putative ABC transport system permease protein